MVKLLQGYNVSPNEIKAYFDYDNNFDQLLEDYLQSGDMERIFNNGKTEDKGKFIRNQRSQLKHLYQDDDQEKPRIKLFKKWISNTNEMKLNHINSKIDNTDKDKIILELKKELNRVKEEYDKTILDLTNENNAYIKKIKKLKKRLKKQPPVHSPASESVVADSVYGDSRVEEEPVIKEKPVSPSRPSGEATLRVIKEKVKSDHAMQEDEDTVAAKQRIIDIKTKRKLKKETLKLEDNYIKSLNECESLFKKNATKHKSKKNKILNDWMDGEITEEEAKESVICLVKEIMKLSNYEKTDIEFENLKTTEFINLEFITKIKNNCFNICVNNLDLEWNGEYLKVI